MRYGEIYGIEFEGNYYIGQCLGWSPSRWSKHLKLLRSNKHHNKRLQGFFNEKGITGLTFFVCETGVREDKLDIRENHWHRQYCAISERPKNIIKDEQRKEIVSCVIGGMKYRDIAEKYGVSLGTVGKYWQQANLYNEK